MPKHYTIQQVVLATHVTERCLHYWDRTGVVGPSRQADGAGIYRGYTRTEVVLVSIVKRMREAGVTLRRIRAAMPSIRRTVTTAHRSGATVRLLTDGGTPLILVKTGDPSGTAEVLFDALRAGQVALALAVEPVAKEIHGALSAPKWRPRTHTQDSPPRRVLVSV